MSFTMSSTFKWPVTFEYAEAGEHKKQKFTAIFKRVPLEEFQELLLNDSGQEDPGNVKVLRRILDEVFEDFEEVEFEGEREDCKEQLKTDVTVANALVDAYTHATTGGRRGKQLKKPR